MFTKNVKLHERSFVLSYYTQYWSTSMRTDPRISTCINVCVLYYMVYRDETMLLRPLSGGRTLIILFSNPMIITYPFLFSIAYLPP